MADQGRRNDYIPGPLRPLSLRAMSGRLESQVRPVDTDLVSRFRASPLAIRLYAVGFFLLVWAPVPFDHGSAPAGTFVAAFLLTLIPFVFLLRGSRIAWIVLLVIEVAALILNLLVGPRWPAVVEAILVALLLAPSSRAFVWRRSSEA